MTAVPSASADPKESVWAVVVNWNGGEANLSCIDSLLLAGLVPERVVFVDNGSEDASLEFVRNAQPGLSFIQNESNLGFGEAANQGAQQALDAGATAVFFVNNDLRVEADTLDELLKAMQADAGLGVAGPLVMYDDDSRRVWCAGGRLDYRQNLSTLIGHGSTRSEEFAKSFDVDYIVGCAMLVKREVMLEIGLLRADYFAYMEDVEFCLRARRAGHGVRTIGAVRAWHAPSSATGGGYNPRRKYMQGVNSVRFLREYGGLREWLRFLVFDVLSLTPVLLVALLQGRGRGVLAKAAGIFAGLRGRQVEAQVLRPGGLWLW